VLEILAVTGSRLHPDQDLTGKRIQVTQLVQQHVPSILAIGEGRVLDHQTFVRSADTASTGLASDVNPTDLLDRDFLAGGSR